MAADEKKKRISGFPEWYSFGGEDIQLLGNHKDTSAEEWTTGTFDAESLVSFYTEDTVENYLSNMTEAPPTLPSETSVFVKYQGYPSDSYRWAPFSDYVGQCLQNIGGAETVDNILTLYDGSIAMNYLSELSSPSDLSAASFLMYEDDTGMCTAEGDVLTPYMSEFLSVHLSEYLSLYLDDYMSGYMPDYMSTFMSETMPNYLSVYMSDYMSETMPGYMSDYMSEYMSSHHYWEDSHYSSLKDVYLSATPYTTYDPTSEYMVIYDDGVLSSFTQITVEDFLSMVGTSPIPINTLFQNAWYSSDKLSVSTNEIFYKGDDADSHYRCTISDFFYANASIIQDIVSNYLNP